MKGVCLTTPADASPTPADPTFAPYDRTRDDRQRWNTANQKRPSPHRAPHGRPQVSAARRSATRSSGDSMPQERRTRSAGTAASDPSTDWCVITCGTSINDSTPPRDSARENRRVAEAIPVASGWRKETIPPKPGQRTSVTPSAPRRYSLTARALSVCAPTRRWSVRRPRWTRKQSSGPGTAPTEFWTKRTRSWSAGSATITAPPTTSEWPPRYLVVEWTTASAPSSRGRWRAGVAKVLSTQTRASRECSTTAEMSTTLSSGFNGVGVGLVDQVEGQAPARENLVHEPEGAAVEIAGEDDVVAGLTHGREQRVLGGHAAGERGGEATLEFAQGPLKRRPGGVGRAGVVVVLGELARRRLDVRRRLMDRRDDRSVRGVRLEPSVDGPGREAGFVAAHRAIDSTRSALVTIPAGRPSTVTSSASV